MVTRKPAPAAAPGKGSQGVLCVWAALCLAFVWGCDASAPAPAAGSAAPARSGAPGASAIPHSVPVEGGAGEAVPVAAARPPQGWTARAPGLEERPLAPASTSETGKAFTEMTSRAGVVHRHRRGIFDAKLSNIMPWISSIGAAAAAGDYDGDGDPDLYLTTSRQGEPNALYENLGGWKFREVAREAGVADLNGPEGVSMDAAFADLDNDGDLDLYVVEWGRNRLFRNNGDRTFTDVTGESGTGDRGNGNCVLPFDYDGDGLLDLFVCNYFPPVDLQRLETTRIMHDSFEAARNGGPNVLYRNLGGLRFQEVAHNLQLDDRGWSLDAGISDIDNDGDPDLYIANDFGQDRFFLNNGDGTFTDFTLQAIGRETFKGMNVDFGDFDGDGFTDAYVANITTKEYLREGNLLWRNNGDRTFTNVSATTGTFDGGWGWCARFFDYDSDGDLDILAVNGFVTQGPEEYWEDLATIAVDPTFEPADASRWPPMGGRSLSGREAARLFRNEGDGSFREAAAEAGIADKRDGRGIALADFDGDGDLDVYIANQDAVGALFRNDAGADRGRIAVFLVGTRSNRNAIGARVEALARRPGGGVLRLVREVNGVNGFSSQSDYALHFGLGDAERVERLTVIWPSGVVQVFENLPHGRAYRITEEGEPLPREKLLESFFVRAGRPAAAEGAGAHEPALLLELEGLLRLKPRNARLANRYRALCVEHGRFERAIAFLRALAKEHPFPEVRLQLALALVDRIPAVQGDVMLQGSLAKEALQELALAQKERPDSFAVHYVTAMNHLYWPAGFRHFDDAVRHFERCLEIEESRRARGLPPHPALRDVYAGLGDAHVKGKRIPVARAVWRRGLDLFPGDPKLEERLALSNAELTEFINRARGLEKRIDTALEFLAEENGLDGKEAAIREQPERTLLNAYRLEAYEVDALDRAARFLEGELQRREEEPELRLALALVERDRALASEAGRAAELRSRAAEHLAAFQRLKPGDWLGAYLEGRLALEEGRIQAAVTPLENAYRTVLDPEGGLPRVCACAVQFGDALALAGDAAGARRVWESAARGACTAEVRRRIEAPYAEVTRLVQAEIELEARRPIDLEELRDREAELAALEERLAARFERASADRYRRIALEAGEAERAARFFEELLVKRPEDPEIRLELVFALLDRVPSPELGSVGKGLLSSQALEALGPLLEAYPKRWELHYLEGLIHLNWFTRLKHVPLAIRAFERCLALFEEDARPDPRRARVYAAIGDAYVKENRFVVARSRHWRRGIELYPDDPELQERWGLTSLMVNRFVEERRSWEARVDTWELSELIGALGPGGLKEAGR